MENPPVHLPGEYKGVGIEVIGDPSGRKGEGTLTFLEGAFSTLALTGEDMPWSPQTDEAWRSNNKRQQILDEVEDAAIRIRENPNDEEAKLCLLRHRKKARQAEPRMRWIERAANVIQMSGMRTSNHANSPVERAVVIALMEQAAKLGRPPAMHEVTAAMRELKDGNGAMTTGADKDLAKVVTALGFGWLQRRPRGRTRE